MVNEEKKTVWLNFVWCLSENDISKAKIKNRNYNEWLILHIPIYIDIIYETMNVKGITMKIKYPIFLFPGSTKLLQRTHPHCLRFVSAQSLLESFTPSPWRHSTPFPPKSSRTVLVNVSGGRHIAKYCGSPGLNLSAAFSPVSRSFLLETCSSFGFYTTTLSSWSSYGIGFSYSPLLVSGPLTVEWPLDILSSLATQTPSVLSSSSVASRPPVGWWLLIFYLQLRPFPSSSLLYAAANKIDSSGCLVCFSN